MNFSEEAQEDVVAADHRGGLDTRLIDRSGAGLSDRPIHLQLVLGINRLPTFAAARLRRYVLGAIYRWKGRKRKLGYRNYRPWKLFAIFCFLGLLGGFLIGSLR